MQIDVKQYKHAPEILEIELNGKKLNKKFINKIDNYKLYLAKNKIQFIRKNLFFNNNINTKKWIKVTFDNRVIKTGTVANYKELLEFIKIMQNKYNFYQYKIEFLNNSNFKNKK